MSVIPELWDAFRWRARAWKWEVGRREELSKASRGGALEFGAWLGAAFCCPTCIGGTGMVGSRRCLLIPFWPFEYAHTASVAYLVIPLNSLYVDQTGLLSTHTSP